MEKDLTLNPKFFSKEGFLNRKGFFQNYLYLLMATSPFWLIAYIFVLIPKLSDSEVILLMIGILIGISSFIFGILIMPSIVKRLNDINGKLNKKFNLIYIISFFITIILAIAVDPTFYLLNIAFYIHLFSSKGKLSSKLSHDVLQEFNWGAYFGTWIWGLVNKTYNTLWILPIFLTPLASFPFKSYL